MFAAILLAGTSSRIVKKRVRFIVKLFSKLWITYSVFGGASYTSAATFCCLLLIWSVVEGS